MKILEFMKDIADNVAISGKKYDIRIPISDGGSNSYISICIDAEDFDHKLPQMNEIRIFRNTNSVDKFKNMWGFELGNICNSYSDYPNIALKFWSYGKTFDEAESEAIKYFAKLHELIKKQTSDYKIADAESARAEYDKLLARLKELEAPNE